MPQPVYKWFPEHRRAWQEWTYLLGMGVRFKTDGRHIQWSELTDQVLADACIIYHRGNHTKALRFIGNARALFKKSLRRSCRFAAMEGPTLQRIESVTKWVKAGKLSGDNPEEHGTSEAGGSTPPLASNLLPVSKSQARRFAIQSGVTVPMSQPKRKTQ